MVCRQLERGWGWVENTKLTSLQSTLRGTVALGALHLLSWLATQGPRKRLDGSGFQMGRLRPAAGELHPGGDTA